MEATKRIKESLVAEKEALEKVTELSQTTDLSMHDA